jgi:hypothetical protein
MGMVMKRSTLCVYRKRVHHRRQTNIEQDTLLLDFFVFMFCKQKTKEENDDFLCITPGVINFYLIFSVYILRVGDGAYIPPPLTLTLIKVVNSSQF